MKKNNFFRAILPILSFALLVGCEDSTLTDDDSNVDGDDSGLSDGDGDSDSSDTVIAATSVSFDEEEVSIYVGQEYQLEYTTEPANANNITFESADEEMVTVDENGVVTGEAKNGAWIAIRNISGSLQDFCYVKVSTLFVNSLAFTTDEYGAKAFTVVVGGDPVELTYTTDPEVEGARPEITWLIDTSYDANPDEEEDTDAAATAAADDTVTDEEDAVVAEPVASNKLISIDKYGFATGLSSGDVTLTAVDVNGIYYDQCTVTVAVSPETYSMDETLSLSVNGTYTIVPEYGSSLGVVYPSPAVTWMSTNEAVATVVDGKVTGKGAGTAYIFLLLDGVTLATCIVTVS